MDGSVHSIGLWRGLRTLVDDRKREVPMERFEPPAPPVSSLLALLLASLLCSLLVLPC